MRAYLTRLAGELPRAQGFFLYTSQILFSTNLHHPLTRTKLLTPTALMSTSRTFTTSPSSSNFQLIFNDALKLYERHTKKNLLAHPLAAELQDCNSPTKILAVLQQQVQGLDQSLSNDHRWTKWLEPTVNVLYMLSETLGEGISLVSLKT